MRRYDLDWLRVLLFGLLVPYHAAIGFVRYGGNVYGYRNQDIAGEWLEMLIFFSHTWRLPALFMISGVGSWFLLKHGTWRFLKNRMIRLLLSLLVAVLVWNVAHGYYFQLASGNEPGLVSFYRQWLLEPRWGHARHLWFLINLFLYGLLLMLLAPLFRRMGDIGLVKFALGLFGTAVTIELILKPLSYDRPLDYRDFWYIPFFFAGYIAMAQSEQFWTRLARWRWPLLVIGVAMSLAFMPIYAAYPAADAGLLSNGGWLAQGRPYQNTITAIHSVAYSANAVIWCAIVFGFAHHNLNRPSGILLRLNRAVYPVFILHFPIMMVGLYYLREVSWPWGIEWGVLTLGTFIVSYALYFALDQTKVTRPLVGLSLNVPSANA